MPVLEEKVNGNLKTVSYQESPIMSTYLVAVVVGLFDHVEDQTPDGIDLNFFSFLALLIMSSMFFCFTIRKYHILQELLYEYTSRLAR